MCVYVCMYIYIYVYISLSLSLARVFFCIFHIGMLPSDYG